MSTETIRICFVCLGNICRSPTAEGAMRRLVLEAGLGDRFVIASAGTGAYHVGQSADPRSRAEALRRGLSLDGRARQFGVADFDEFDYVVAMDRQNQRDLERLAGDAARRGKVHLLRSFDLSARREFDVPDPYQGGADGFARVFDICQAGCEGLLAHLRATHGL
jgi:protein-tyrosine phosphatase